MKSLPILALSLLVTLSAAATAAPAESVRSPAATVSLTGGTATADALLASVDGGQLESASLASLLPHVRNGAEFRVTKLAEAGELVKVHAVARDGRVQLVLPVPGAVREHVEIRQGDVLNARVQGDLVMSFRKGETLLGFLLKPGVSLRN